LLTDYYEVRQWDRRSGRPTVEKLRQLDLADVAEELY